MPWIPLIIGAGVGLAQASEQAQQESAQRKVAATTIAYSPWTKANINDAENSIHPATYATDALGGAAAGARYAQGGYGPNGGNTNINATPAQLTSMQTNLHQLQQNMKGSPYQAPPQAAAAPGTWVPGMVNQNQNPLDAPFWKQSPYGGS